MKQLIAILLLLSACGSELYSYDYSEVRIATVDEWESRFGLLPDSCNNIWTVKEVGVSKIDKCSVPGRFGGCAHTASGYFDALNNVPACMRAKTTAHELEHFLAKCMLDDSDGDHDLPELWDRTSENSIETAVWHNVGCPNY